MTCRECGQPAVLSGLCREHLAERRRAPRTPATAERRHVYRVNRYGIEVDDFARMLFEQGLTCAICPTTITAQTAQIDHDHRTGKVRGLLCGPCNRAIGLMRDDPERLERAARYLSERAD